MATTPLSDMHDYLSRAEAEARSQGLSDAFRQNFARIADFLADEDAINRPLPETFIPHLTALREMMIREGAVDEPQILKRLLATCNQCLGYWDAGAMYRHVLDNLELIYQRLYMKS
ncbi:hypothetical protein ACKC9G_12350 [Pokkaliibacter sp. CJK22405]|uniref:hypothetical protein n=1 Tax=Pokkaliibacter sp. CJK22405 TaxID=3384615 RepID=UPI003984FF77